MTPHAHVGLWPAEHIRDRLGERRRRRRERRDPAGHAVDEPLRNSAHRKCDSRHSVSRRFDADQPVGLRPHARHHEQVRRRERVFDAGTPAPSLEGDRQGTRGAAGLPGARGPGRSRAAVAEHAHVYTPVTPAGQQRGGID